MVQKKPLVILFLTFFFAAGFFALFAQGEKKIKVAVLPPSASGDASASVSQGLTSVIVTELSRSLSLEVSDRRDVEKALKEQAFGLSGCTDQSCQIELGKILQSKWVVTGDLNKIGTLYILTLKILNVETSKIEYQDEEEYKGEVEGLVPKTKALTSRLADFLLTGKKPVKPVEKAETPFVPKETTEKTKTVPQKEGMVYIPAGWFWMGSDEGELEIVCDVDKCKFEKDDVGHSKYFSPKHKVYLDAYYIDKYEVTNVHYKECVIAGKCQKPERTEQYDDGNKTNHPVVSVNWFMAESFCKWAGKRLPTEAEWEKAARGENGNIWPWGNEFDCKKSCNSVSPCKQSSTCAVGSYESDVSSYGVYDMAGNVFEWVSDWYAENYYKNAPEKNPKGPNKGKQRMIHSGSWLGDLSVLSYSATRVGNSPNNSIGSLGFRCAAD